MIKTPVRSQVAIAIGGLLLCLAAPLSVGATTLRYRSVAELAQEADAVVWGNVRRVGTRMERAARGRVRPTREAHIEVLEVLRGQSSQALTVHLLGGAHRSGEHRVHGEAELREGEEVVLFLTASGDAWRVLGMGLGVLRVRRSGAGVPRLVRQLREATLLSAGGEERPALDETLSFEELRATVRHAADAPSRTGP